MLDINVGIEVEGHDTLEGVEHVTRAVGVNDCRAQGEVSGNSGNLDCYRAGGAGITQAMKLVSEVSAQDVGRVIHREVGDAILTDEFAPTKIACATYDPTPG